MINKNRFFAMLILLAVVMSVSSIPIGDEEDYCLTGGGTENQGQCTTYEGYPGEGGEGTVSIRWCAAVIAGAPGSTLDCSGNSLEPKDALEP